MLRLILVIYLIGLTVGKGGRRLNGEISTATNLDNYDFEAFFSDWQSTTEINTAMKALYTLGSKETAHISLYSIGKSAEGRPIYVLSLGKSALELSALLKKRKPKKNFVWKESFALPYDDPERNEVAVLGTLHGREWSAASSVLFSCWEAIKSLQTDSSAFFDTTYHFVPVMNPDGLQFTFDRKINSGTDTQFSSMGAMNGRLWRKNRRNLCSRKMRGHKCAHGIDLNRNFGIADVSWGFGNSKPTTEVFQGKRPFSEPESKRIGQWLALVGRRLKAVIDVHCCSSALLPPFFYRDGLQAVASEVQEVCEAVSADLGANYPCKTRESSFSDSNTGIFADWLANEVQIPFVFILETRGNSASRKMEKIFLVPKEDILAIGGEVNAALLSLKKHLFKVVPEEVELELEVDSAAIELEEDVNAEEELQRLFQELESGAQAVTEVQSLELSFNELLEDFSEPVVEPMEAELVKITSDEQEEEEVIWSWGVPPQNIHLSPTPLLILTIAVVFLLYASKRSNRSKKQKKRFNKII